MLIDEILREKCNSRADEYNRTTSSEFKMNQKAVDALVVEVKSRLIDKIMGDVDDGLLTVLAYKNGSTSSPETFSKHSDIITPEETSKSLTAASGGKAAVISDIKEFYELWSKLPPPIRGRKGSYNKAITEKFRTRMKDEYFRENWKEALEAMGQDPHCLGENDRNWVADKAYFLKPETVDRLLSRKDVRSLQEKEKPKKEIPHQFI